MSLIVKICGLSTPEALDVALDAGADMVGFVFFPPSPRHLAFDAARMLGDRVRGRARKVALTVDADDATFEAIVESLRPDLLQLHGKETPARVTALKRRFGRPVMKAIPVEAKATSRWSPTMSRPPIGYCLMPARRARRPARAASAKYSTGGFWRISIPACRSCCRAGLMPLMSARRCASPARPESMSRPASSARRATKTLIGFAPSSAPPARRLGV